MERVTFRNSRNLSLVGHYYDARSGAAIVFSHGFASDKSSDGRFDRMAEALESDGYRVLTFDFSGCGESDDDVLDLSHQIDDLKCAISFVQSKGAESIGLHGHSLGGLVCLMTSSPDVRAMVLTGALTDSMKYDWTSIYSAGQLHKLEVDGYLLTTDRSGRQRKIGRDILHEFDRIDQKELLQSVKCPVLLIHGNDPNDWEELELLKRSRKGIHMLPDQSRLEVIDGANHGFRGHYDHVIALTQEWYRRFIVREEARKAKC